MALKSENKQTKVDIKKSTIRSVNIHSEINNEDITTQDDKGENGGLKNTYCRIPSRIVYASSKYYWNDCVDESKCTKIKSIKA